MGEAAEAAHRADHVQAVVEQDLEATLSIRNRHHRRHRPQQTVVDEGACATLPGRRAVAVAFYLHVEVVAGAFDHQLWVAPAPDVQ